MAVKYTEEQLNSVDKSFLIQLLLQQQEQLEAMTKELHASNENDFIFYVLHKSQGKFRIRNFFYWVFGNDFQTLHQHLILVCGNLQRFLFCTGPSEVPVFNPLVQK